jgi:hypothetical protein
VIGKTLSARYKADFGTAVSLGKQIDENKTSYDKKKTERKEGSRGSRKVTDSGETRN